MLSALTALVALPCASTHAYETPTDQRRLACEPGPDADCSGADLRFVDLAGKDLRGAKFRGADLSRADLRRANLVGADFTDVVAYATDFSRAYLAQSIFVRARLTGANFESARMSKSNFTDADLTAANLSAAWAIGCRFINAKLDSVDAQETKFSTSTLQNASMRGTKIRFAVFSEVAFDGCIECPTDW